MTDDGDDGLDPRGLIREAFRIEGITEPDCRSIFFDWALGHSAETEMRQAIEALLTAYADAPADHPMISVLREGLTASEPPARGRRSARRRERWQPPPDMPPDKSPAGEEPIGGEPIGEEPIEDASDGYASATRATSKGGQGRS